VVALGELLTRLGARVTGAGTHTITVEGTLERGGATVTNIPDMLEAGLFILLGAVCAEDLVIENVPLTHLPLFFKKLEDIGVDFSIDQAKNQVRVRQSPLQSFSMQSLPHPGIPTDLQAPFAVVATVAPGSSLIHDPLYEDRFRHINELQKMGGRAVVCDPHRVIIQGPVRLHGTEIDSLDIRSGATLIMAGLVAEGQTIIHGAEVVERGYERLAERLQAIGAAIRCRDAVHA
ncbi:MAG TPA: UDP-N-acetylglucosamine 1-carboxyvinyltransferase, partial [Candidatus Andersenbacteria bacterium]|nr:UDP-N-acetylglucosamine 1-carboxyvinyltransferase [Candidatus Andersenbacteria bacterium]